MNGVAAQIIELPRKFHTLGNVSFSSLLRATSYFEVYDQISEAEIREALARCPENIQEWMQYSEDKRTSGWYIIENNKRYEVGCVAEDGDRKKQVQYKNQIDACASFIKREIEDLRSL